MLFCAKKDITQIIFFIFTIKKFTASELRILMRLCSRFHTSKLRLDYEATRGAGRVSSIMLYAAVADLLLQARRPGDSRTPIRLNLTSILLNWHTMPIKFKRGQYAHTQCCTH
jgi:hypothetical protein